MSNFRQARVHYLNNWKPAIPSRPRLFRAEEALLAAIDRSNVDLYQPPRLPHSNHERYHFYLSFIIDALELLPLKLDLAFDSLWRAFESILTERSNNHYTKQNEVLSEYCHTYHGRAGALRDFALRTNQLFSIIPAQSCEYLTSRIFESYSPPDGASKRIRDRLQWSNHNPALLSLLDEIAKKYQLPLGTSDHRKASMLLRLVVQGRAVTVGAFTGALSEAERLSLVVLCFLTTFRNDRFHGNVQPPFKSSTATLRTYAHAHFAFLTTMTLLLQELAHSGWVALPDDELSYNMKTNTEMFALMYRNVLTK